MRVFLAGVMQGSRADHLIVDQDYRARIAECLRAHLLDVQITDPHANDPNSVAYSLDQARQVFESNASQAADADIVIAYLPEASMGTAIEMWSAYQAGRPIIAVTPLVHNWVVRVTARHVLPDLESLLHFIEAGMLSDLLPE
jgi:nucleoside 2-deoxyribosyltransferase